MGTTHGKRRLRTFTLCDEVVTIEMMERVKSFNVGIVAFVYDVLV